MTINGTLAEATPVVDATNGGQYLPGLNEGFVAGGDSVAAPANSGEQIDPREAEVTNSFPTNNTWDYNGQIFIATPA